MGGKAVEDAVLRRLRSAGGVNVWAGSKTDLRVSVMGAEPVTLVLQVKHRLSDEVLQQVAALQENLEHPVVLVVREISPKRRDELRFRNISWIEYGTGVAHLRAPGLAIDLPEEPSRTAVAEARVVPNLAGKAGVVVEALLELAQEREYVTQPEVAKLSGSTQAWTSKVFGRLVEAGALDVFGAGPQKEWRPRAEALLDLWVKDGGPAPMSTALYVWARSAEHLVGRLMQLDLAQVRYAIGGVTAGNLHEPTLSSPPVPNVWIPAATPPEQVARSLGGEIVVTGANLIVWQAPGDPALRLAKKLAYWRVPAQHEIANLSVVTPARAVVECMHAPGRGPEVGERLRQEILDRSTARLTNRAD
jgi:hypothetical protein